VSVFWSVFGCSFRVLLGRFGSVSGPPPVPGPSYASSALVLGLGFPGFRPGLALFSAGFGLSLGPPARDRSPCPSFRGLFGGPWPAPVRACFRLFSAPFWPFSAFSGSRAPKGPNMALTGPCHVGPLAGFGRFWPFLPVFGLFWPSGPPGPNPYRLVTGSRVLFWPVSWLFGPFGPFPGPSGPLCPVFGFTARSVWASGPLFWPFSRLLSRGPKRGRPAACSGPPGPQMYHFGLLLVAPFGGHQKAPSRGLPSSPGAPNVPLLVPFGALLAPYSGLRPKSGGILQRFLASRENAEECRLILGLRPRGPPRHRAPSKVPLLYVRLGPGPCPGPKPGLIP